MRSPLLWELALLLACSSGLPALDPFLTPPSFLLLLSSITFLTIFSWWDLTCPPPLISVLAVARGGSLKGSQAPLGPASLYLLSKDGKQTLFRTLSTLSDLNKSSSACGREPGHSLLF